MSELQVAQNSDSGNVSDEARAIASAGSIDDCINAINHEFNSTPQSEWKETLRQDWVGLVNLFRGTGKVLLETLSNVKKEHFDVSKYCQSPEGLDTYEAFQSSRIATICRSADALVSSRRSERVSMDRKEIHKAVEESWSAAEAVVREKSDLVQRQYRSDVTLLRADAREVKCRLESVVDFRLDVAERGERQSTGEAVSEEGAEFALSSSPVDLDAHRKTNSARWMNDVLKWQVLDVNLARRRGASRAELAELVASKKALVRAALEKRVDEMVEEAALSRANQAVSDWPTLVTQALHDDTRLLPPPALDEQLRQAESLMDQIRQVVGEEPQTANQSVLDMEEEVARREAELVAMEEARREKAADLLLRQQNAETDLKRVNERIAKHKRQPSLLDFTAPLAPTSKANSVDESDARLYSTGS